VNELQNLISVANIYLTLPATEIKEPLIRQVSKYVFYILKCFGVYSEDDAPSVLNEEQAVDYEAQITPLMNVLSQFRDKVKQSADEGPKSLFQLSD